jgi:2-iminobutanoate/2-iminopropanoate deaminase
MPRIQPIHAPGTSRPAGHYSQAVVHGGLVYVSGQLPADLETGTMRIGHVEEQTELTLANVGRILEAAGSGLDQVLQMTVYVSSIDDWPAVNAAYARVMGEHRPARAVVPVPALHYGAAVEIQAVAAVRPRRRTTARRTRTGRQLTRRRPR